jgi:hypothetical protein
VIKPSSDDYYVETHVVHEGPLSWSWTASLCQPWPSLDGVLSTDSGWRTTEKRAKRKADRVARQMMRAAASWTTRTYRAEDPAP